MRSPISKHSSGRNYNSPLHQERSLETNVDVNKEEKSISPSVNLTMNKVSANVQGSMTPKNIGYNAGLGYSNKGFTAGVGVSGSNKSNPNITGHIGYKTTF
jgi:hypothetical protein